MRTRLAPCLLLLWTAAPVLAQEAPPIPGLGPVRPVGITISGGVSLGTWEAGFMYLYLEAQKARPQAQLRVATGASAGSANALISALTSCLPSNPDPTADLGWRAWEPIGFHQLFDPKRARDSIFVRDALEGAIERVRERWNEGFPESCDVVFGASVTRVEPRQVEVKPGLTVPRALETFVVRIQGRGPGVAPKLTNYVDPWAPSPMPLLVLRDDDSAESDTHNFEQLRAVLFASAAFPVAFQPVRIDYCLSKPGRRGSLGDTRCLAPEFSELFLDGGVFDNNPLRLAWSVAERFLRAGADGTAAWQDPRALTTVEGHLELEHLSLDPDTEVYPPEPVVRSREAEAGILGTLFSVSGGMLESARSRELAQLATEKQGVSERLHLAMSNLPKASEHLNAFLGFFERDFRRFDFYVGMYDAFVELRTSPAWESSTVDFDAILGSNEANRRGWAPFLCLLSMTEPDYAAYRGHCEGEALQNFRILLQVSLDRLYQRCRPLAGRLAPAASRPHHHCEQASAGAQPPQVPGVKVLSFAERQRWPSESRFDFFMRLLERYDFEFADLELRRGQAGDGRLALRQHLDEVVDAWAGSQATFADQTLSQSAGRTALHGIAFSPPARSGYVTVGTTLQAGLSLAPFSWRVRWLQATGAVGLGLIETLVTESRRPRLTLVASAGPEVHLTALSSAVLQPRLALRGGVQLGAFDGFGLGTCELAESRDCTQGVVELVGSVSLFERLRFHVLWQTFPRLVGRTPSFFHLHFGIGFQFL